MLSWIVIHPADVIKVRMQLANEGNKQPYRGFLQAATSITRHEGLSALYAGLSAALTRQLTYTTLRLGLYSSLREKLSDNNPNGTLPLSTKFAIGTAAGGIASAVATPVEVSMVRMYNDGAAEPAVRRGYRNIGDALVRIGREEGLAGLWRGATPTIARSMLANCVQLATYDQAKDSYKGMGMKEGIPLHLVASATSGLCYSFVTLPVDAAKTKVQNQRPNKDGSLPYRNLGHAIVRMAADDGVASMWRGFFPYFSRCAGRLLSSSIYVSIETQCSRFILTFLFCFRFALGHTVVMFLVLEQVKKVM